ncbi:MAG TPA: RtcB family protein, partial [Kofleriaceae bacterium]|nr:RtcB family protein [Kofleriaceae bacterium]
MMAAKTSLRADQLPDDLKPLRLAIEAAVPHGRTDHGGKNDRGAWGDVPALHAAAWAQLEPEYGEILEAVNCHHNYISREHHYDENVIVTRKGAVRARPGELGIIPGSMGARSFIVRGKGNPDSFTSCSHGEAGAAAMVDAAAAIDVPPAFAHRARRRRGRRRRPAPGPRVRGPGRARSVRPPAALPAATAPADVA